MNVAITNVSFCMAYKIKPEKQTWCIRLIMADFITNKGTLEANSSDHAWIGWVTLHGFPTTFGYQMLWWTPEGRRISNRPKRPWASVKCIGTKDETNLEFHSNRISHRISSKFRIRMEYRIELECSVAPNSIRILNGVEMSCRDRVAGKFYTSLFCEVYSFKWL